MESIDRGARSQAKLIEDLLDVSRIVSGKLSLTMTPVDLRAVLSAAMDSQRPAAQTKNIRLEMGAAAPDCAVVGDVGRLQQVFLNILSNALKFTPAGGQVSVTLESTEDCARVSICGHRRRHLAGEFLPYVFDRFRQADGTSTRNHMGLGLGLAIVKHVVEMHGGRVVAKSEGVGKGATFVVTLPLAGEVEGRPARPDRRPDAGRAACRRRHWASACSSWKTTSRRATSSPPSSSAAGSRIGWPRAPARRSPCWTTGSRMSSCPTSVCRTWTATRSRAQLRARPAAQGGHIPALALSAFARAEDRELALRSGYQAHIAKPVEPADLVKAIATLTGHSAGPGSLTRHRRR